MFFKDKKVLVTGGTGFVGSHFVEELLRRGARVRVPLHRNSLGFQDDSLETIPADLNNLDQCFKVCEGVDYVIHAAGAVGSAAVKVDKAMAAITSNLVLTALMLQAAWAEGVDPVASWSVLEGRLPDGAIPAVADQTVILWGLGKAVGDTLTIMDGRGRPRALRLVAGLQNSIFQG